MTCHPAINMTAEWALFRRRLLLGLLLAPLVLVVGYWHALTETRVARDLLLRTPFYGVVVTESSASVHHITLRGYMTKRRCEYRGLTAYVLDGDLWRRAVLDTSPEDGVSPTGNRPPGAQWWGAWHILARPSMAVPRAWRIFAHHLCPEDGGAAQVNLFAEGEWR